MTCRQVEDLLDAYVDRELDVVRCQEIEQHLGECQRCSQSLQRLRTTSLMLRNELPYHRAPESLRERIGGVSPSIPSAPSRRLYPLAWLATAAALLLGISLGWAVATWRQSGGQGQRLAQEVVAAHIRSLMANHLADVPSSDQHTVKPWFDGKIDFAPPVEDLAEQGFPLVGGRLDYLDNRPVAALAYRYRQHPINLFVWPAGPNDSRRESMAVRDGYNLIHWTDGAMECWAVSDASASTLQAFADAVRAHARP